MQNVEWWWHGGHWQHLYILLNVCLQAIGGLLLFDWFLTNHATIINKHGVVEFGVHGRLDSCSHVLSMSTCSGILEMGYQCHVHVAT